MKRVIIVHCWEGYPNYAWYQSVKKDLKDKGFQVEIPDMPETELPKLDKWLSKLTKVIGNVDDDTYLVGHSIGSVTILRYLESLNGKQKVGGVILVAGFTDNLEFKELSNFFQTPLDFEKIKSKSDNYIFIHSDNDPYVDLKYCEELKEKLGGKLIVKQNMGHFSGEVDNEASCTTLPDVTETILEISRN